MIAFMFTFIMIASAEEKKTDPEKNPKLPKKR